MKVVAHIALITTIQQNSNESTIVAVLDTLAYVYTVYFFVGVMIPHPNLCFN